ncbi:MAG: zinc ribbon domain-containing protein [Clostridiales bacterium]|nr:zinc ribbon domain-containing protein [Clostridiales bacterium]MBQ2155358.1 zinc ribbon domain-containing protein [Clostridiales bacterium]
MFCSNCGAPLGDQDKFCKACGTPVSVQPAAPQPAPAQPVAAPAPVSAPVAAAPIAQPVPAAVPVAQPVPQPAPVYQQPVTAAPQPAPALANAKGGPRRACFVVGLITCILLIIETLPALAIGCTMLIAGPIGMIFGASNSEDLLGYGLLICLGGFILMDMAIISIVFNGICTKITAKRPASKCRALRMAAAIMVLADAAIVIAPVIGLNQIMSDAQFFYGIFAVTFIMAAVFFVLALITNSKEKKLAAA